MKVGKTERADGVGSLGAERDGRRWWRLAVLPLAAGLLAAGLVGVLAAAWWGGAGAARAAWLGWWLVVVGTAGSWWVTWRYAGRWLALLHVTSGFIGRAIIPLATAALLMRWQPAWRRDGLLWWTFGFYLVGLVADTWFFLRLMRDQVAPSGRAGDE
jgi:hypothetical protein